jgi:hypothetical protein
MDVDEVNQRCFCLMSSCSHLWHKNNNKKGKPNGGGELKGACRPGLLRLSPSYCSSRVDLGEVLR